MNQVDLFNKLIELSPNKIALSSIISNADILGNIMAGHTGDLFVYGFDGECELTFTLKMKKQAYLEITNLLSQVIKS